MFNRLAMKRVNYTHTVQGDVLTDAPLMGALLSCALSSYTTGQGKRPSSAFIFGTVQSDLSPTSKSDAAVV